MAFIFADCKTKPFDLSRLLKEPARFPPDYVRDANAARQRMCDTLLSQPTSQTLLGAIESYLGYLFFMTENLDVKAISKNSHKFSWCSVISRGTRVSLNSEAYEKPMVTNASIYFEVVETLLAYAFALANIAASKVGGSLSGASEDQCNAAADLFARSSGVFAYINKVWIYRWAERKDCPPECNAHLLTLFSTFMFAEANRVALAKAEKRSMSPTSLIKLGAAVLEEYTKCIELLAAIPKAELEQVVGAFMSFIRDGSRLIEASILKRLATIKHEESENGLAVACLSRAINGLKKNSSALWVPWRREADIMIPECQELLNSITQINNNITFQRVPDLDSVKTHIPAGRPVIEAKAFAPPMPHHPPPPPPGNPE